VASDAEHATESQTGPGTPATLGRRFLALLADWILCLLVAYLLSRLTGVDQRIWSLAVLVVEYAFFIGLFAQTPGMRLTRIACVSVPDGHPIGIGRAALRGVLLALAVPAVIMDKDGRGLHDKAARSIVVHTD